ncbi:MAG: GlsB/YeaQ/YmgE family stress response membrane protein [Lysobacterales bacterium]
MENLLIFLAIGAIAGWLAGSFMKGKGFGLLGNMIVGIIGAMVGGFAFGLLGLSANGIIGNIIMSTVGAMLLLFTVKLLKKV